MPAWGAVLVTENVITDRVLDGAVAPPDCWVPVDLDCCERTPQLPQVDYDAPSHSDGVYAGMATAT